MSSQDWDNCYKDNKQMSTWPWSNLVSLVMRYASPNKPKFRVLELGCGAGANIPFFLSLNVEYFAIESSPTIVEVLKKKFPNLKDNIVVGDFTKNLHFKNNFDLVIDRSSVTHNATKDIKQCLDAVYDALYDGGKYIGVDWFSTLNPEYKSGKHDQDIFTRTDYTNGQFANVGRVHFSDKSHLLDLFNKFKILLLQHSIVEIQIPKNSKIIAVWDLVAEK